MLETLDKEIKDIIASQQKRKVVISLCGSAIDLLFCFSNVQNTGFLSWCGLFKYFNHVIMHGKVSIFLNKILWCGYPLE